MSRSRKRKGDFVEIVGGKRTTISGFFKGVRGGKGGGGEGRCEFLGTRTNGRLPQETKTLKKKGVTKESGGLSGDPKSTRDHLAKKGRGF